MNNTNSIPAVATETINSTIIDILHGAKSAGSEIYGASKQAISESIDFISQQTPLVIQEFLHWKFYEAVIHFTAMFVVFCFFVWIGKKCIRQIKEESNYAAPASVILLILMFLVPAIGIDCFSRCKTAIKIKVAPRVYMIEYVADHIRQRK